MALFKTNDIPPDGKKTKSISALVIEERKQREAERRKKKEARNSKKYENLNQDDKKFLKWAVSNGYAEDDMDSWEKYFALAEKYNEETGSNLHIPKNTKALLGKPNKFLNAVTAAEEDVFNTSKGKSTNPDQMSWEKIINPLGENITSGSDNNITSDIDDLLSSPKSKTQSNGSSQQPNINKGNPLYTKGDYNIYSTTNEFDSVPEDYNYINPEKILPEKAKQIMTEAGLKWQGYDDFLQRSTDHIYGPVHNAINGAIENGTIDMDEIDSQEAIENQKIGYSQRGEMGGPATLEELSKNQAIKPSEDGILAQARDGAGTGTDTESNVDAGDDYGTEIEESDKKQGLYSKYKPFAMGVKGIEMVNNALSWANHAKMPTSTNYDRVAVNSTRTNPGDIFSRAEGEINKLFRSGAHTKRALGLTDAISDLTDYYDATNKALGTQSQANVQASNADAGQNASKAAMADQANSQIGMQEDYSEFRKKLMKEQLITKDKQMLNQGLSDMVRIPMTFDQAEKREKRANTLFNARLLRMKQGQ